MSRLRIFAGPNGSGKSTLYQQISATVNAGVFINADHIEYQLSKTGLIDIADYGITPHAQEWKNFKHTSHAKSLINKAKSKGLKIDIELKENFLVDVKKESHSYESSLAAMFIRYCLLHRNRTFSFETVMSHHSKIKEIIKANEAGYRSYMYFVCTADPLVNISRIRNRVTKGGHNVDDKKAIDRYHKSLSLLIDAVKNCYRAYLFDNSGNEMKLIAETFQNEIKILDNKVPNWLEQYLLKYYE